MRSADTLTVDGISEISNRRDISVNAPAELVFRCLSRLAFSAAGFGEQSERWADLPCIVSPTHSEVRWTAVMAAMRSMERGSPRAEIMGSRGFCAERCMVLQEAFGGP
jgi:hypothetical protein